MLVDKVLYNENMVSELFFHNEIGLDVCCLINKENVPVDSSIVIDSVSYTLYEFYRFLMEHKDEIVNLNYWSFDNDFENVCILLYIPRPIDIEFRKCLNFETIGLNRNIELTLYMRDVSDYGIVDLTSISRRLIDSYTDRVVGRQDKKGSGALKYSLRVYLVNSPKKGVDILVKDLDMFTQLIAKNQFIRIGKYVY